MLRYFARNIKGSDDSWRACTDDLEQWINHHVGRGHGPPTFFVTLSCAKNWWPDLRHLVYQFEVIGGHYIKAQAIKHGCRKAMSNATRKFPLYVNNFLWSVPIHSWRKLWKKHSNEYYWGPVEFALGRGTIHLHIVAIAKNKAYLEEFDNASSLHQKAEVLNKHAINHLDMMADVKVIDHWDHRPDYLTSPLTRR
jgi:hypothetical protein